MNKKGQLEMADLAGFLLILIAVLVFGFVFIFLSPKAKIEILETEHENLLARNEILNYLSYEEDGKNMADIIVLAVEKDDLTSIEEKTKELLKSNYKLYFRQDDKLFKIGWGAAPFYESEYFNMYIENFDGPLIEVGIDLATVGMAK